MPKLKNPFTKRETEVGIESDEERVLGGGLEGMVDTVKVSLGDEGNEVSWQMARKTFVDAENAREYWETYLNNWTELKKRGMPVVPTVRFEKGSQQPYIIMTDLTQQGKNEVVALNDFEPPEEEREYMLRVDGRERVFKYSQDYVLEINNSSKISQEVGELFKLACEKGVVLEHDMIFLVIDNNTREGHLLLGDLRTVEFMSEKEVLEKPVYEDGDDIISIEQKNHEELISWCRFLNENLSNDNQIDMSYLNESFHKVLEVLDERRRELGITIFEEDDWF